MRLIVSGGGTGGHVYPALAVLEVLGRPPYNVAPEDVLYLGVPGRAEADLVPRAGYPFVPIASGAVRGRSPLQVAASAGRLMAGTQQALGLVRRFRPDAVFATGGYVSVPVVLAGWLARTPVLLLLPDAEPGLAVRFLARFANTVAVSTPQRALPATKVVVTGYPVRSGFGAIPRAEACARWGLDPALPVLLVLGGSLGAHAVNGAIAGGLSRLLEVCQVIHVSGRDDTPWLQDRAADLSPQQRARYILRPYVHQGMAEAMAAADLAICRAGASILGELPVSGLPAVLVPYPHAGEHQLANARYLVDAGAALLITEDRSRDLVPAVMRLLGDRLLLEAMRARAAALARPDAAGQIASLLAALAARRPAAGPPHPGVAKELTSPTIIQTKAGPPPGSTG